MILVVVSAHLSLLSSLASVSEREKTKVREAREERWIYIEREKDWDVRRAVEGAPKNFLLLERGRNRLAMAVDERGILP